MRRLVQILAALAPVVAAEMMADWWMTGGSVPDEPVLDVGIPEPGWTNKPSDFEEVRPALRCNTGWMAYRDGDDENPMVLSVFRWDATDTGNTLEAFKHLPEQCMGSIGMKLEKIHPRRVVSTPHGELVFDSTQFRAGEGGRVVHVFKCVWVHGYRGSDLRGGVMMGGDGYQLRQLRFAAALERFRPRHTRVVMGAVHGMPTESLAWKNFRTVLEKELFWSALSP